LAEDSQEIRLKNFLYADWNVVLSLYSQLFEGVSEYKLSEKSKGKEAGIEAKGGIPLFKAGGHAELSATDTETEKVLRHHDLYNQLEEGLLRFGLAKSIEPDFDVSNWSDFQDSDLLLVRPQLIRFTNYKDMLALFQNSMPFFLTMQKNQQVSELEQELQDLKERNENPIRQQAIRKAIKQVETETPDITAEGLDFIAEFLGLRLKVLPNKENNGNYFVCSCDPNLFTGSLDFIKNQYGVNIEGPWTVLGQVNVPVLEAFEFNSSGSQLDDLLDGFFIQTQQEFFNLSGVAYPAISLNPICIYRETVNSVEYTDRGEEPGNE